MFAIYVTVSQDQDGITAFDCIDSACAQSGQTCFNAVRAPSGRIANVQFEAAELVARQFGDAADTRHFFCIQNRLVDLKAQRWIDIVNVEQVWLGPNKGNQRHHHLLPDGINRWVSHLSKKLTEIVVEGFCTT